MLSIDCGTPETWRKIKGFNNFDKAIENLEKYREYTTRPNQIRFKYIILPGINDSADDYEGLIEIMKRLDIRILHEMRILTENAFLVKLSIRLAVRH